MKKISFNEFLKLTQSELDETEIISGNSIYLDFSDENEVKREEGVDTIMFETENNKTIIIEQDCKTKKIIGLEIV